MYYSKSLLNHLLTFSESPDLVADMMTLKVCEVEEVKERSLPDLMVVGFVTSTKDHSDAEKLTVCQVDCGSIWSFQICCGATNVRAGIYVVVALPGCHLPAIDLTIEPRQLRWEDSNGMICSKAELGIEEDSEHKWIWSLKKWPDAAASAKGEIETVRDMQWLTESDIGKPLSEVAPGLDSWTMDVENKTITHRPDMFGHGWLAIELKTMLNDTTSTPLLEQMIALWKQPKAFESTDHGISIQVDTDKVLAYGTILLEDIDIQPSWLFTRLTMLDLKLLTRSNRVDFSNTFMYLTGQPIHFFDADKIEWGLIIRQAKKDERFVDLFDKEHTLTEDDIVIADHKKICALAGIIWANNSGIDDKTKRILVEIANFDPIQVRKTWTRLGLRTDAELRFEKTINPVWTEQCMHFFLEILWLSADKIWGSWSHPELPCNYQWWHIIIHSLFTHERRSIPLSRDWIWTIVGADVKDEWMKILESLWFDVTDTEALVPIWRSPDDIETQACIIEEITRIQWFDQIPEIEYKDGSTHKPFTPEVKQRRVLEWLMIDRLWFDQVETYPWIHTKRRKLFGIHDAWLVQMQNGLNPERTHLRPTMIWGLLEVIQKNAPFFPTMKLFDIWNVRYQDSDTINEESRIAFALVSPSSDNSLASSYTQAKWIIDQILKSSAAKWKLQYSLSEEPYFHPLQQASLSLNNQEIGSLVTIHSYYAQQIKLPEWLNVVFAQLNLTKLLEIAESQKKSSRWMSSYETLQDQIITRDINFVIDNSTWYGEVNKELLKIKEVKWTEVFDLYAGEHLPEGKKSIAIRLKIIWEIELKTEDINAIMDKAVENVKWVGGELR